ncbi:putative zinc finger CCHC domain-containing protein At4g19190 [Nicotiana tabacum]|uniref:Zinc finger CCHC domain-containing protein At4g19190 n=1 Tax=Nicotiana tabacum TaxID=4097 RepID=A0A1S4A026_TOBAC
MEEEGGGFRLSKRFSDKGGEVDYKTKAGTAWSHNFLNQKPWHPLSYPNQRRKWIAEQTHAQREQRANEIAREYAQEQEYFRQTALVSKKEKEKMEMMKAVSFMYVRPPGYNPESAKAAEIADEAQKQGHVGTSQETSAAGASISGRPEVPPVQEKKKPRPKDVFGRLLPTEEEFEVLKNAPRLETGVAGRAKPFGIEIRNVKCVRCGAFGHQSGDRECPLKDAIMPNEESRIKRDDPLTAILAQTDASEPLKWELKQKPGLSPPRGGFNLDDPNQQIVAEDIFDEYGGFLTGDNVPDLLASLSSKPKKKKKSSKSENRKRSSPARPDLRDHEEITSSSNDDDRGRTPKKKKHKKKSRKRSVSSEDSDRHRKWSSNRQRHSLSTSGKHSESSSEDDDNDRHRKRSNRQHRQRHSLSTSGKHSESSSEDDDNDRHRKRSNRQHRQRHSLSTSRKHSESSSEDDDNDRHRKRSNRQHKKKNHNESSRGKHSESSSEDDNNNRHRKRNNRHRHSRSSSPVPEDKEHRKKQYSESSRGKHSESSSEDDDNDRHRKRSNRHRRSRSSSPEPEDKERRKKNRHYRHHHSRHNHSDYS